ELAAHDRVRIYTIAFGGDGGRRLFGLSMPSTRNSLDEESLRQMAQMTGGQFFRARNSDELAGIYARIDGLEPVEVAAAVQRLRLERYPPWLAAALALLALLALAALLRGRQ
ncbi:MAG: VWA domain-containing protein, partial [Stenotrophomonas koreensis]